MQELVVYTLDEVAQVLKTSPEVVVDEIESGHLDAFMVGKEWRVTEKNIADFIARGGSQPAPAALARQRISNSGLQRSAAFQYTWPNGFTEEYSEAYEGTVNSGDRQFEVKIGICTRYAAGRDRRRVTVFLNGRPTVEFSGGDNFDEDKLVASLVTLPNRKRLKPNQPIPEEYRSFNVRRYNSVVMGPRAASMMAVVANIQDLDTMVSHAIIRASYRDQ